MFKKTLLSAALVSGLVLHRLTPMVMAMATATTTIGPTTRPTPTTSRTATP